MHARLSGWLYACIAALLLGWNAVALADGKLTNLSGPVQIRKADGTLVVAAPESRVRPGETVLTGANGFARLITTDGGEIVLRPNSEFFMEQYRYSADQPDQDSFVYSLLKGGLRTVTGLIGKRGNRDAYRGQTVTATIGIRGTFFEVRVCNNDCGSLPNGTYFQVRSGSISTGNSFGDITMSAGQIVFVPPDAAPQLLPRDPGIGFTTPQDFPKTEDKPDQEQPGDNAPGGDNAAPPAGDDGVSCSIV